MRDFEEFKPYLSDKGSEFLQKWGIKLLGLYYGGAPRTPNERRFVEVFEGKRDPEGISERIWFNIAAINSILNRCADLEALEDKLGLEESIRRGLTNRLKQLDHETIEPLKAEISRLSKSLQACHRQIEEYERRLGILSPNASSGPGDTCPLCKGTGGMGNCSRCEGRGYL